MSAQNQPPQDERIALEANDPLALALCRALMICMVRVDDRFTEALRGSLEEVAAKLEDEKGAGARDVISNLVNFSRSLHAMPPPSGMLH